MPEVFFTRTIRSPLCDPWEFNPEDDRDELISGHPWNLVLLLAFFDEDLPNLRQKAIIKHIRCMGLAGNYQLRSTLAFTNYEITKILQTSSERSTMLDIRRIDPATGTLPADGRDMPVLGYKTVRGGEYLLYMPWESREKTLNFWYPFDIKNSGLTIGYSCPHTKSPIHMLWIFMGITASFEVGISILMDLQYTNQ